MHSVFSKKGFIWTVAPLPFLASSGTALAAEGTGSPDITRFMTTPLLLGLVLIGIALVLEWRGILHTITLEHRTLASIERKHPRLLPARELMIALLLSAAFGIFLTALGFQAYILSIIPSSPVHTEYATPLLPEE